MAATLAKVKATKPDVLSSIWALKGGFNSNSSDF